MAKHETRRKLLQHRGLIWSSPFVTHDGVAVRADGVEEVAPVKGMCLGHAELRADSAIELNLAENADLEITPALLPKPIE